MIKGNVLVLKGESRYNVLRTATDLMIDAFTNIGYKVTLLDLAIKEEQDRIEEELEKGYDLVFSFQAVLFDLKIEGTQDALLGQVESTIMFGHIVDHPLYHGRRLHLNHGKNMYVACIDRNHKRYIDDCYSGVKNTLYLPHAGFKAKRIVPYEEREIDIFFPSSYRTPVNVSKEIEELADVYQSIANILITAMLSNRMLTLQTALAQYFSSVNFTYTEEDFILLMDIFSVVDQYIRAYTREQLIQHILNSGLKLTVCGSGWDTCEFIHHPNLHHIGENGVNFLETVEIMANSKTVLNHIPTLQEGMHERIFTSMRCGAICLTNDFPIMHEEFEDVTNILLYSDIYLDEFVNRLKDVLHNTHEAKAIALRGQIIAESNYKWEDNANRILDIVGLR